jgi:hypothetical protein
MTQPTIMEFDQSELLILLESLSNFQMERRDDVEFSQEIRELREKIKTTFTK